MPSSTRVRCKAARKPTPHCRARLVRAIDEAAIVSQERAAEVVALDDALKELATVDPKQSQIVELRFFGGLTIEETAEVLHLSPATIKREWSTAKAWLYQELVKSN